jgi:hypothetical protein
MRGEFLFFLPACAHTDAVPLAQILWVDFPELRLSENESVEMPFRYVKGMDGLPVVPEVRMDSSAPPSPVYNWW